MSDQKIQYKPIWYKGAIAGYMIVAATALAAETSNTPATAPATTTAPAAEKKTEAPKPKPAKVAMFRWSNALLERPADFSLSLFGSTSPKSPALSNLMTTLNKALQDHTLEGVMVELNSFELSFSQAQELGKIFKELRAAKKRVALFASDFDTATYLLGTYADTLIMPEQGNIHIPGVGFNLLFLRGTLDNIHIEPDFIQVGKFKGAEEAFMRTEASPEYRAQIEGLADGLYNQLVKTISENRGISAEEAKAAIDTSLLTGKQAMEAGLVDHVMNRDQLHDWLEDQFKDGTDQIANYGQPRKKNVDMSNPFAIFQMLGSEKKATRTNQPAVAVIYADAEITNDLPDGYADDEYVTPSRIRTAVEHALHDDQIKAIVLRVDSPGGSASASDEIWQILRDADKIKPVTISMGRMAASGGYYIASAGRSITADPATITGSIGVVGGKLVASGLLNWAGITMQPVTRGKRAMMFSSLQKFTDDERTFLTQHMTDIYDLFLARIKTTRDGKVKDLPEIAQGKLYTGEAAMKVGLVDQLGTLRETVATAAKEAHIDANYQILVYPESRTFSDVLRDGLLADTASPLSSTPQLNILLQALPADVRQQAVRLFKLGQQFDREQIMTVFVDGLLEK